MLKEHRFAWAAAVIALVAAGSVLTSGGKPISGTPTPSPTPRAPFIAIKQTSDLAVLPGTPDDIRLEATKQIGTFLKDFYARGFLQTPNLGAIEDLVAPATLPRFAPQRDAFAKGEDVAVQRGNLDFGGLLYTKDATVLGALLKVNFTADGRFLIAPPRIARFAEQGQLLLHATPDGWRLAGFDVVLNVESAATGNPVGSPQAFRARWMP